MSPLWIFLETLDYLGILGILDSLDYFTTTLRITTTQPVERTIFSADGRRMNGLNKGLNIIKTKTADGKTVIRKVVVK